MFTHNWRQISVYRLPEQDCRPDLLDAVKSLDLKTSMPLGIPHFKSPGSLRAGADVRLVPLLRPPSRRDPAGPPALWRPPPPRATSGRFGAGRTGRRMRKPISFRGRGACTPQPWKPSKRVRRLFDRAMELIGGKSVSFLPPLLRLDMVVKLTCVLPTDVTVGKARRTGCMASR